MTDGSSDTDLANRRAFEHTFDHLGPDDHPLSVVVFDLDHFKQINDVHGHGAGDGVLKRFAALQADHTPTRACAARLGGEEFCLMLPNTPLQTAKAITQAIIDATPDATADPTVRTGVTTSAGIATAHRPRPQSRSTLLTEADTALYHAKTQGRNQFQTTARPTVT